MLSMLTVPDEREAPAADEHVGVVGQRAPPAVAVADRQRGELGLLRRRRSAARSRRSRPARIGLTASDLRSAAPAPARAPCAAGSSPNGSIPYSATPGRTMSKCAPARAASRRCWRRARPRRGSARAAARPGAKALELLVEERVAALVGGGEVRHQPRRAASPARARATRVASRRVARAQPAHAGVELDVHARASRRGRARRANSSRQATTSASAAERDRRAPRRSSAPMTSIGAVDAGGAQRARLLRRRHREPRRAARRARRAPPATAPWP